MTKAIDMSIQAVSPVSIAGACVAPSTGKAVGASPSRPLCGLWTPPGLVLKFVFVLLQVLSERQWVEQLIHR